VFAQMMEGLAAQSTDQKTSLIKPTDPKVRRTA